MLALPVPRRHTAAESTTSLRDAAGRALLYLAIGIELLVIVTWWPETLRIWSDPETHGYGDFNVFYANARTFGLNNMYSPGLQVLMHPLTYLPMERAFAIYFGINVAALVAVAYVAQRAVASLPAKAAVALGVFALPQTHWALRVGHFTEILAIAALGGLLLSDRKPVTAGVLIAVLALKPQYLVVPLVYLLWTRNWRAFGTASGGLALLALVGIAAMVVRDPAGIAVIGSTAQYYGDKVPGLIRYFTVEQGDALYMQSWQYSWYGFLVSIDADRNPLVAGALTALSAVAVAAVWWRCSPSVAKVAVAIGMLLLTPHTTFYNWSILAVAAALLLHSDLRPRALVPALIALMSIAAAATQQATPFPLPVDRYRPAGTDGIYWIQPAALLSLFILAIAGRAEASASRTKAGRYPANVFKVLPTKISAPLRLCGENPLALAPVCIAALAFGYVAAAYVSHSGPFAQSALFSRSEVVAALPGDFPAPDGAQLSNAGPGERLPYRIEWSADAPVSAVAGVMQRRLDDGSWSIVNAPAAAADPGAVQLRSTRQSSGSPPLLAEVQIRSDGAGSIVRLEFTPLPPSSIPGYERWLESVGLVVHSVDRRLIDDTE